MSQEIVVYAFDDLPVKIVWIDHNGEILKMQLIQYEEEEHGGDE